MQALTDENTLKELKEFFGMATLPGKISMAPGSTITDVPKFIEAQFNYAGAEGNSPIRKLALERLLQLRSILSNQK